MSKHSDFHLIFFQIEGAWQDFTVVTNWLIKNFKSLYRFGGRCLKIRDVCIDFELYFKVNNLVPVYPKSIMLGQMTNLNMIFHAVVPVYRLVKIWNSPEFPDEFRNGQLFSWAVLNLEEDFNNFYRERTATSLVYTILVQLVRLFTFPRQSKGKHNLKLNGRILQAAEICQRGR